MLNQTSKASRSSERSRSLVGSAKHITVPPRASTTQMESEATEPFTFKSNLDGALFWSAFGYKVIPIIPRAKRPSIPHQLWLGDLSNDKIRRHWAKRPTDEVGAVLDDTQLMLDADTDEAATALTALEKQFGIVPSLIIKTRRGEHHHYLLAKGTFAKSDSHHTKDYPARIDVRAARSSVLLTPSQDKLVICNLASHRDGMVQVNQDFVDAVFRHNGRQVPRPIDDELETRPTGATTDLTKLSQLLAHIDPDCGYNDWLTVLMVLFHETDGSDAGLELAVKWSQKGKSYKNRADLETKWRTFKRDVSRPVTIASLIALARAAGADIASIMSEDFERCETTVVSAAQSMPATKASPLRAYSLTGQTAKYEKMAQEATPLLSQLCLKGEAVVWYAKYNTGKTLIFLHLVCEAIEQNRLASDDVYFINADDSSSGIATKLNILDEYGAHMLVPGQNGFEAGNLKDLLLKAVKNDTARNTLVVIDTLKKFTDLMHKREASEFANVCRQFVTAGGTVLGFAHTNKRRGEDGKAIYAGTSDILDDFDAGYLIDDSDVSGQSGERFVEFKRMKGRGGGVETEFYAYANDDNLTYAVRLASVRRLNEDELSGLKQIEAQLNDADIIAVASKFIATGIQTKMALRNAVAEKADISRRSATRIIEKYTGDDPAQHHWRYVVKAHGAKTYELLNRA